MISHHHLLCLNKAISPRGHLTQKLHRHGLERAASFSSRWLMQFGSKTGGAWGEEGEFLLSSRFAHLAGPADKGKSHIPAKPPPGSPARSCLKRSGKANVSLGCTKSYFRACSYSSTHVTCTSGSRRKAAASRPRTFEGPWKCCTKRGRQGGGQEGAPGAARSEIPGATIGGAPACGHTVSPAPLGCVRLPNPVSPPSPQPRHPGRGS